MLFNKITKHEEESSGMLSKWKQDDLIAIILMWQTSAWPLVGNEDNKQCPTRKPSLPNENETIDCII